MNFFFSFIPFSSIHHLFKSFLPLQVWRVSHFSYVNRYRTTEIWERLLSPSGDLRMVWSEITYPYYPPHPTFWSECWNFLQTELNLLWWALSCFQNDVRCSQMFWDDLKMLSIAHRLSTDNPDELRMSLDVPRCSQMFLDVLYVFTDVFGCFLHVL